MAANTCQYMTKLPARSRISDSFALVGFYISHFFAAFLPYGFMTMLFSNAVFIRRLANGWAAIQSQTRFYFSALLHIAASPLFSSGILHTPCIHPTFTTQISPSPSSLNHQCWIMLFLRSESWAMELGYGLVRRELWISENVPLVPFTAVACRSSRLMEQHQTESLMHIERGQRRGLWSESVIHTKIVQDTLWSLPDGTNAK